MKIYHNPKCSKSRQAKQALELANIDYDIHLYLSNPLSEKNLEDLLQKLNLNIKNIIRVKEDIWKNDFKGNEYSDAELIRIVSENPRLLERPIIEHNGFAVIARSEDKIREILNTY